jgi:hypothetical protein
MSAEDMWGRGMSPNEMHELGSDFFSGKSNLSPGECDQLGHQWQMTSEICRRLDALANDDKGATLLWILAGAVSGVAFAALFIRFFLV